MTQLQHVYLSAHGSYASGSWLGESAQFGLRLTFEQSDARPTRGTPYTPGPCGDVVPDTGTTAGTHGTLTRVWKARVGPAGSTNDCDAAAQIDLAEDVWTFLDALKAYVYSTFKWTHVKLCPIGADGKAIGHSSIYTYTTPLSGAASAQTLPPQVAMAVSMRAPVIGRKGRGRIYLPLSGPTLAADATIGSGTANNVRAAMVTLLGNLENSPGLPAYSPTVAIMSAGSATALRPVEVRTGNRFDTVRSRRQAVAEAYTSTSL